MAETWHRRHRPTQADQTQNLKEKRPTNTPDSLDDVLAEMLGIPKQGKPGQTTA